MKLGIYIDMRNPEPWRTTWTELYQSTVDLVVEAEQRGADAVWLTEHHGFDDGYLSQPLTMAAALAARTRSVRIGTAVLLAPLRHVLHVAEEAALVDVLSAGRLELGIGAGYVRAEFQAFGADESKRYVTTEAMVLRLQELFARGALKPSPVQSEIPLWLGYQGPRGARRAGALGVGLLSLERELYARYRQGRAEAGVAGPGRMAGVVNLIVARDPDRSWEAVLPHLAYHLNSYRQALAAGRREHPPRPLDVASLRQELASAGSARGYRILDPEQAVEHLEARTAGLPFEHLLFWCRIAGMPEWVVEEHIELLFGKVRHRLAERSSGRAVPEV
jgi:alkanesulfonate monooxygenase SsuD/methylene tetrahydromethanopterin reductase-like flavin-dependent oxidoreductase (luciferase family)